MVDSTLAEKIPSGRPSPLRVISPLLAWLANSGRYLYYLCQDPFIRQGLRCPYVICVLVNTFFIHVTSNFRGEILNWKICVSFCDEALKMILWIEFYATSKQVFLNLLRLPLVIVVAFSVVQIAGLVVDCLKGPHAASREGVCEKVLTQNGP